MTPEQQGSRLAWKVIGIVAGLDVLAVLISMLFGDGLPVFVWMISLLATPVLGLIAASIVSTRLQDQARRAYWLTMLIGVAVMVGVFGVTCGMSLVGLNL